MRLLCVVTLLNKLQNIVLQNEKVFFFAKCILRQNYKVYLCKSEVYIFNAKYMELLRDDKPLLVGSPAGRVITDLMLRARLI